MSRQGLCCRVVDVPHLRSCGGSRGAASPTAWWLVYKAVQCASKAPCILSPTHVHGTTRANGNSVQSPKRAQNRSIQGCQVIYIICFLCVITFAVKNIYHVSFLEEVTHAK